MRWLTVLALSCCFFLVAGPAQAAPQAQVAWTASYDNGTNDSSTALAVDAQGNIYVTGSSEDPTLIPDYLTIKYDPAGQQLWTARYDGAGRFDFPAAIAVDDQGNTYVTGASESATGVDDYATIRYGPNGQQLWARRFDAWNGAHDQASDLAVDAQGNIYVTGWSYLSGSGTDYLTIKYDPSGNVVWTARTSGTGSQNDYAHAVRVDAVGNVFVTGEIVIDFDGRYRDYGTVKYDPEGNQAWLAPYTSPITPGSLDVPHGMELDAAGNVYVTGESWGSGPGCCTIDWASIKYDTQGNRLWVRRVDGPTHGQDIANDIAIDGAGNVVVTGQLTTETTNTGVVKYDPAGRILWRAIHDDRSLDESSFAVATDAAGNVFTTGYRLNGGIDFDWVTLAYSARGRLVGRAQFGGDAGLIDDPADIAAVPGGIVVTGSSFNANLSDFTTIKYIP